MLTRVYIFLPSISIRGGSDVLQDQSRSVQQRQTVRPTSLETETAEVAEVAAEAFQYIICIAHLSTREGLGTVPSQRAPRGIGASVGLYYT